MYQTELNGKHYELGTSGFLYRSSKLMYDHETKSLWSTLQGVPVVGALVDRDISLKRRYVVTTTWGQWKKRHPETTVLSLDTGHRRDYGEGVAYKRYFATDELMFKVPGKDDRLLNKDSVVALRDDDNQLAISAKFLARNPVFSDKLGDQKFVVLTNGVGANRVYDSQGIIFTSYDRENIVTDASGTQWSVSESELTAGTRSLPRLPSHRAFWFGWSSQFPNTRLVK